MDGLLCIRSKCEGLLIDEAIRQNQNAVFKNLDPSMRLFWTGGFYNLTINVKRVLRLTLTHSKQKRLFLMYQSVFFFVDKIFSLVFLNFFLEFFLLTNYLNSTLSYIPGSIFRIGFFPTCLWGKVQGYGKKLLLKRTQMTFLSIRKLFFFTLSDQIKKVLYLLLCWFVLGVRIIITNE